MTEPDDLFSFLDEPSVKSARPVLPNLANSLRDEGLLPQQGKDESASIEPQEAEEQSSPALTAVDPSVPDEIQPEAPVAPSEFEAAVAPATVVRDEPEAEEQPLASQPPMSAPAAAPSAHVDPPNPWVALAPDSRLSRRLIVGSGAVIGLAVAGWLLASYIHKESAPPIVVQAPQVEAPTPAPAPVVVEQPAPEPVAVITEPAPEALPPPVPEPAVTPPQASPKRTSQPKAGSPDTKKVEKPAPKPEPQWQDDAMDALDDLEKRL
ncbi:MAG: hypothetical protein J0L89_04300 [Xanthomonadales bacterium]|nr:hypothetical protein [Xanthomonadales bacterium]